MKNYLALVTALSMGFLLLVLLFAGIGLAQGPGGDNPDFPWQSSAPVLDGVQSQSPPDQPPGVGAGIDEVDQTYDAFLQIVGSALKPRDSSVQWMSTGDGGCIYASGGNDEAVFNTPVYLPQGSTVKYLRMYYNDTNASANTYACFTVYNLYGYIVSEWCVPSSGSGGSGYMTTSEFTHTVDYTYYSYVVNWLPYDLGSGLQLCGLRIFYHTPPGSTFLPLVSKPTD